MCVPLCCFKESICKDKEGRAKQREGKEEMRRWDCVCASEESLHEQQLLGSLSALARAGNHRSSPCSRALTVCVCLYVCEWMSECVYALRGRW